MRGRTVRSGIEEGSQVTSSGNMRMQRPRVTTMNACDIVGTAIASSARRPERVAMRTLSAGDFRCNL